VGRGLAPAFSSWRSRATSQDTRAASHSTRTEATTYDARAALSVRARSILHRGEGALFAAQVVGPRRWLGLTGSCNRTQEKPLVCGLPRRLRPGVVRRCSWRRCSSARDAARGDEGDGWKREGKCIVRAKARGKRLDRRVERAIRGGQPADRTGKHKRNTTQISPQNGDKTYPLPPHSW